MEIIGKVIPQGALIKREYTDRAGQQVIFKSLPVLICHGSESIMAEITGDMAESFRDENRTYIITCRFAVRSYVKREGGEGRVQDCTIYSLQEL